MTGENIGSKRIIKWTNPFSPPVIGGLWGFINKDSNVINMDYFQGIS
jgi:hypothetical protein